MKYSQDEVNRRRKERRRRIIKKRIITGLISLFILSLVVLAILCITVFFPVEQVSVTGSKKYTPEQVVSASGITQDTNLILVSEKSLTEKLRVKLPFVDDVNIKRDFPNHLIITVSDAKEYACLKKDKEYYTVSKKGYVLNSYRKKPKNVFEIVCDKQDLVAGTKAVLKKESQVEIITQIVENLNSKSIAIDYVDVSDSLNLEIKVSGRFIVNLGTNTNIDKKIAHLGGMLKKIEPEKTGNINLSMWSSQKTEGTFVETEIK